MTAPNLFEQQARNRRLTATLIVVFVLFFAWVGFGGDLALYLWTLESPPEAYHHTVPWAGIVITGIAALMAWRAYRRGADRVLWSAGAIPLTTPHTHEQKQLLNVVEEMAIAAGLPTPKAYLVPDPDPNAFATGRGPESARIAVTTGLLQTLSREELQAVVGHEMAHVRNYDVRLMTTLAALVGTIVLVSDGMGRVLGRGRGRGWGRGWGGGRGIGVWGRGHGGTGAQGQGGGRKGDAGAIALVILVLWLLTLLVAPLVSRALALAVSRRREFLADATSAELTRNPGALASALQKIEAAEAPTSSMKRGTAHLCIADPLGRKVNLREGRLADLLATHPPMAMRISRLRGMAYQQLKAAGAGPGAET